MFQGHDFIDGNFGLKVVKMRVLPAFPPHPKTHFCHSSFLAIQCSYFMVYLYFCFIYFTSSSEKVIRISPVLTFLFLTLSLISQYLSLSGRRC